MKTEPILQELEAVKAQLAAAARGDSRRFLDQMDAWLAEHPHAGPVVNSSAELQSRVRVREAVEPPPRGEPYVVHDSIIAEIHRTRAALYQESHTEAFVLKDEPPRKKN